MPFRIVLAGLLVQIKLAQSTGVCAHAGEVLPVAVVTGDIVVHQLLLKPGGAVTPVLGQFIDQATGHQLPSPVTDITCEPELVHGGVDQRVGCGAPAPALEIWPIKDRKSTRLNSSHVRISYAVFCLKKKNKNKKQ